MSLKILKKPIHKIITFRKLKNENKYYIKQNLKISHIITIRLPIKDYKVCIGLTWTEAEEDEGIEVRNIM